MAGEQPVEQGLQDGRWGCSLQALQHHRRKSAGANQARTRRGATGQQRHGRGHGASADAGFSPRAAGVSAATRCAAGGRTGAGPWVSAHQQKAKAHCPSAQWRRMARSERA